LIWRALPLALQVGADSWLGAVDQGSGKLLLLSGAPAAAPMSTTPRLGSWASWRRRC